MSGALLALAYASLGDIDRAFGALETGLSRRDSLMLGIRITPFPPAVTEDPRFADLVRRIGLPE